MAELQVGAQFSLGDIVRMKGSYPTMVVTEVDLKAPRPICCEWMGPDGLWRFAWFQQYALILVEKNYG